MATCALCGWHVHEDNIAFKSYSYAVCDACLATRFPNLAKLRQNSEYIEDTLRNSALAFWPTYIRTTALAATCGVAPFAPIIVVSQKVPFQLKMTFLFFWVGSLIALISVRLIVEFYCTMLRLPRVCRIDNEICEIHVNGKVNMVKIDRCTWREGYFAKERNFCLFLKRRPIVVLEIPGDEVALGHGEVSVDSWRELMEIYRIPKRPTIGWRVASDLWFTVPSAIGIVSAIVIAFTCQSEMVLTQGIACAYATGCGVWLARTFAEIWRIQELKQSTHITAI